jgi:ubiquinone biosynthesis protein UbiJ
MTQHGPTIDEIRESVREFTMFMRQVVANPGIILQFDPVEIAWFMEHLELLNEESKDLAKRIQEMIDKKK